MTTKLTFKPGDTLKWAGTVTLEGVTDYTGWTLAAAVRAVDPATGALGATVLASVTCSWLDQVAGVLQLLVPAATTAAWPAGAELALDIKLTSPDGSITTTETAVFYTKPRVTP